MRPAQPINPVKINKRYQAGPKKGPVRAETAETMATKQKDISRLRVFAKNRHLLRV